MNFLNTLSNKTQGWTLTGLGAVIALAAFLPWVNIVFFSVNGFDAHYGKVTLLAGLVLAVVGVLHARQPEGVTRTATYIVGGIASLATTGAVTILAITLIHTRLTTDTSNEFEEAIMSSASPGIGMILTGVLGFAAVVLCVNGFFESRKVPQIEAVEAIAA